MEDLRHKASIRGWRPGLVSALKACLSEGGAAVIIYRLMRFFQTHRFSPLAYFYYRLNAHLSHTVIGRGADIGPGFVIEHTFGVVINSSVRAGQNLVIQHGVTIGENHGRSPVLGDNVFIGAGAKVIGDVRIGSDVQIGANAVVTKDLPDGATAVGIPARVVRLWGRRIDQADPDAMLTPTTDAILSPAADAAESPRNGNGVAANSATR